MMHMRILVIAMLVCVSTTAQAVTLQLDFSTDTSNFFGINPDAQAALEAAADQLNGLISTSLGATVDSNEATNNTATVTFDHSLNYVHPSTGATATLDSAVTPADLVRVFVGARSLAGPAGKGGPGGAGTGASGGFINAGDLPGAVTSAAAASTANLSRGGGPLIGSLNGNLGGTAFTIDYGLSLGSVAFDPSIDWHFDHTTDVPVDKIDFFSVALHELLHGLGIGSEAWNVLVSGDDWLGPNVIALVGSGEGLVDTGDFAHIAEGTMSTILGTGIPQEAVMDPSITSGQRKLLTTLDVAFLQDIGWQAVPEPASWTLALIAAGLIAVYHRARHRWTSGE